VIEQTIRRKLPDNFQTAEFCLEHGLIDMVVPRHEMRATLGRLLRFFGAPQMPSAEPIAAGMVGARPSDPGSGGSA
jgi:acetyl-CoA carboxylase carboxyl transferase subunit beta